MSAPAGLQAPAESEPVGDRPSGAGQPGAAELAARAVAPDPTLRGGLRVLRAGIRAEPRVFALAVLASTLFGTMTVAQASLVGWITGHVVVGEFRAGHARSATLVGAAAAVLGVSGAKILGIIGRRLLGGTMQYRLQATYRRQISRRYLALPYAWHQAHPTGELLSTANADVEATWFPIAPLPFAVGTLVMLVLTTALLLHTDLLLSAVGFVIFPAIGLINVGYSRAMASRMGTAQELRGRVSSVAHESIDGALVVKTLGREAEETARFAAQSDGLRDAMIRVGRVHGLFDPLMDALPTAGVLLILGVGAGQVTSGRLTAGSLVEIAYLFTVLAVPLRAIGWVLGELPRATVGWARVQRVLTATGDQPAGDAELTGRGAAHLRTERVDFAHPGGPPVLAGITLDLVAGQTLAVVGPTGSGKSTLAGLLVRLIDPDSGAVLLDGVDLRALAAGQVPGAVALVAQSTFLFDDTVRGNVTLGAPVDDAEVHRALRLAQADRFVAALPHGLDTLVGERGASLSGGQRQRIALARALVRSPRLLVLDDATSSVDPSVEAAILAGLREAGGAVTVVVIAYRRATLSLADEVAVLVGGRVSARGTAEQMLADPHFAAILRAYDTASPDGAAAGEREPAARPAADA